MPKLHTENEPRAKGVLELHPFPEINPSEDVSDQHLADFWMYLTNKYSQLGIQIDRQIDSTYHTS